MSNSEQPCLSVKVLSPLSSSGSEKPDFHRSEALKKAIRRTEVEVEKEYRTFCALSTLSMDSLSPEVIRLKQEYNRRITECERKERLLSRLKEQAAYPIEGNAYTPSDLTDTNLLATGDSLQPTISRLQSTLDHVLLKILEEDQTTEMLKMMHEKANHSQMIMKQRTREVQTVLQRVSHQLVQVNAMRHIAENFLTLAHGETHFMKEEMDAGKERLNDRFYRKMKDRDLMAGKRRKTIERIGIARYHQTEFLKQKQGFIESLDAELKRHLEEKLKLTQANHDISVFVTGFRTIARVLQTHGCIISYDSGLAPDAISTIVSQFNALFVLEGSLASRYSQLTWDYSEKESALQSLRTHLTRLQSNHEDGELGTYRPAIAMPNAELANETDRLSLIIYSDLISLLSHLEAIHERVSGNLPYPESPAGIDWVAIRALTSGMQHTLKDQVANADNFDLRRRIAGRSSTMQPLKSRFSIADDKGNEDETWSRSNGMRMTTSDLRRMLKDAKLELFEQELENFFRHTLVVKCFADGPSVREFLKAAKSQSELRLENLLERCHLSLRREFQSVASFNREVLQSFMHMQMTMSVDPSRKTSNADTQVSDLYMGKRQKEIVRLRLTALSRNQDTDTPSISSPKRQSTSEARRPKPDSRPEDEVTETQHIADLRSQLKSSWQTNPPSQRRSESALVVIRTRKIHETQNPLITQRAKNLLKGFLTTERKISAVKDKERSTFKSQSLRGTPFSVKLSLGHTRVHTSQGLMRKSFRYVHSRGSSSQFFSTAVQD